MYFATDVSIEANEVAKVGKSLWWGANQLLENIDFVWPDIWSYTDIEFQVCVAWNAPVPKKSAKVASQRRLKSMIAPKYIVY